MKYEMVYNADFYTVAANDIIKGKQSMSLQTARLIRLLITQVVKEDKDLKTYECKVQDLANFLQISPSNLYRDVKDICKGAMESVVYIGTGNPKEPWKMFHWLDTAEYNGDGIITLKLSHQLTPYVLELEKWFTQYQLKNILSFKSYYAIRLYEVIKCEDGFSLNSKTELEFEVAKLRQYFDCENKYKAFKDFKKNVIEVAVKDINEKSDIEITPTYRKTGRAVSHISFYIRMNRHLPKIE